MSSTSNWYGINPSWMTSLVPILKTINLASALVAPQARLRNALGGNACLLFETLVQVPIPVVRIYKAKEDAACSL